MSQVTLASLCGVDRSTVQRWCKGSVPRLIHASKIWHYSDGKVTFDDMMRGKNEKRPQSQAENRNPVERGKISE
jgi:hypothetical protein